MNWRKRPSQGVSKKKKGTNSFKGGKELRGGEEGLSVSEKSWKRFMAGDCQWGGQVKGHRTGVEENQGGSFGGDELRATVRPVKKKSTKTKGEKKAKKKRPNF